MKSMRSELKINKINMVNKINKISKFNKFNKKAAITMEFLIIILILSIFAIGVIFFIRGGQNETAERYDEFISVTDQRACVDASLNIKQEEVTIQKDDGTSRTIDCCELYRSNQYVIPVNDDNNVCGEPANT